MSNSYPFKKSILGMIPEGVYVDEDYVKQLAISKGIDIQTICNLWYETMKVEKGVIEIGSSKEALQRTIDERDETIESLEEKIKNLINERDHYKKENMELKEDIKTTGNLLEKSKASHVDLKDKYDTLVEEFRGLENANKNLHKQLQENHMKYNKLCKENNKVRSELENAKDTICKLRDDLEEQYKKVKYMEDNYISREVAKQECKYAEIEIHNRINDTKDLIRAIHTISKFI